MAIGSCTFFFFFSSSQGGYLHSMSRVSFIFIIVFYSEGLSVWLGWERVQAFLGGRYPILYHMLPCILASIFIYVLSTIPLIKF